MYIDFKKKFIYVAVPKTASRTIHDILISSTDNDRFERIWTKDDYHLPYSKITSKYEEVKNFSKYAFVRNPFQRLISTFLDFTINTASHRDFAEKFKKDFNNFEEFIFNFPKSFWSKEIHLRPMSWYLKDKGNQINFDYIGKYENFQNDMINFLKLVELKDFDRKKIPNIGSTKHYRVQKEYFTNKKMIDVVYEFYYEDFSNFGYKI